MNNMFIHKVGELGVLVCLRTNVFCFKFWFLLNICELCVGMITKCCERKALGFWVCMTKVYVKKMLSSHDEF